MVVAVKSEDPRHDEHALKRYPSLTSRGSVGFLITATGVRYSYRTSEHRQERCAW